MDALFVINNVNPVNSMKINANGGPQVETPPGSKMSDMETRHGYMRQGGDGKSSLAMK